jgi:hypothetical protein
MCETCSTLGKYEIYIQSFTGKIWRQEAHGILRRKWKDNIKWALRETVRTCGMTALAQDKDYWRDLVNVVTNFFSMKDGDFFLIQWLLDCQEGLCSMELVNPTKPSGDWDSYAILTRSTDESNKLPQQNIPSIWGITFPRYMSSNKQDLPAVYPISFLLLRSPSQKFHLIGTLNQFNQVHISTIYSSVSVLVLFSYCFSVCIFLPAYMNYLFHSKYLFSFVPYHLYFID